MVDGRTDVGPVGTLVNWIIDGDGHVMEPTDLWERYLPARYRDLAPRLQPHPLGPDGTPDAVTKLLSTRGGTDPSRRLPDMDVDLIERAALFPTLGILMQHVTEPSAAIALHRAVNDWMAEYCAHAPERLLGIGAIPCTSGAAALSEARRCVEELGFAGVFRRPDVPAGTLAVHDAQFEPLWHYLAEADVPIICHSGPSPGYYAERFGEANIASHAVHFVAEAYMALASFTLFGILERHSTLRVGLVECGGSWALGACHRLDEHVEKAQEMIVHYSVPAELSMRPSEYFARQCFVTVEDAELGLGALIETFPRSVLFATDYPHPDGIFPGSTTELLGTSALDDAQRHAVLRDNALALYGLSEGVRQGR
jgi:uncharacterized protein